MYSGPGREHGLQPILEGSNTWSIDSNDESMLIFITITLVNSHRSPSAT